jgi:hypothetical protein
MPAPAVAPFLQISFATITRLASTNSAGAHG